MTVTHRVTFYLLDPDNGSSQKVLTVLSWSPNHPYAVQLEFRGGQKPWIVSRDLLAGRQPGMGDVSLLPCANVRSLELVLSSPTGRACFRVSRQILTDFLDETFAIVAAGSEAMPDKWLTDLIA